MISSIVLFGVFIIIYTIIMEIFTVLFQLTGMIREKAKTQAVSMLTNSGFTTSESELIMASKRRRSLARATMISGYSFSVVIVSIMVNFILTLNNVDATNLLINVVIMAFIVILFMLVMRIKKVRNFFDMLIEKMANRIMFGKKSNVLVLVDMLKNNAIAEAVLENVPECLYEKRLSESGLKENFALHLLDIKRGGEHLQIVDGNTVVQKGDRVLLFGDYKTIRQVFEKPEY